MWLPIIGLIVGIILGLSSELTVPVEYRSYLSIAVLAALDTIFGGIRSYLDNIFDIKVFMSGFFFNTLLAAGLAFLGVYMGIDLYLAAIFAFGVRLFNNIAVIRRIMIGRWFNDKSYKD